MEHAEKSGPAVKLPVVIQHTLNQRSANRLKEQIIADFFICKK
jgi:hypothetical protein